MFDKYYGWNKVPVLQNIQYLYTSTKYEYCHLNMLALKVMMYEVGLPRLVD